MSAKAPTSQHSPSVRFYRPARQLLTCLALTCTAVVADAAGWDVIASVPNAWTESVDPHSIVRDGSIRHAWVQIHYDQPTAIAPGIAPATVLKQRIAFDCKKRQTSLVTRLSYDAQGQLLDRVDTMPTVSTATFSDVAPDTELDRALNYVCAH
ncbi:surface-adhesin E family protein [Burkholderia sp. Ax-1719]|uniref:surface-adhesin E family protein n=1 Tax=Burkholderia sp. Ax-1719 TaxID=2608334 RepID=UPI00141FD61B|nr:surface-adhesin E family protein [Burkholderia sp. Ax-1719]NIE62994.1 hypothetical protein [Burkholderia sp. Ax-1719]